MKRQNHQPQTTQRVFVITVTITVLAAIGTPFLVYSILKLLGV